MANRENTSIATFVAETGGLNCMIADSSTLPEQLVKDVIDSAFMSAGQRCSALRVLYIQEDIADGTLEMLAGQWSKCLSIILSTIHRMWAH